MEHVAHVKELRNFRRKASIWAWCKVEFTLNRHKRNQIFQTNVEVDPYLYIEIISVASKMKPENGHCFPTEFLFTINPISLLKVRIKSQNSVSSICLVQIPHWLLSEGTLFMPILMEGLRVIRTRYYHKSSSDVTQDYLAFVSPLNKIWIQLVHL
jgi:hypothetical protein